MIKQKLRIPWAQPMFGKREKIYLGKAIASGWISRGPFVEKFEKKFIKLLGASYGMATSNGTTALQLALLALGIGPGDEVIVPGLTFVAPANMGLAVGAKPIYADVDPVTWCIDPAKVQGLVTSRTKAIIAVHLYGNVCDILALQKIAAQHHLALIEDTAEAVFSRFQGRYAGTWGDVGCFSFHAAKTITTGEGGFIVTQRKDLFDKISLLADQGQNKGKRYWHDTMGFNFRMTDLQAAVGCGQLDSLKKIIQAKDRVYACYARELGRMEGVQLQVFPAHVKPLVWAIAVKLDPKVFPMSRDEVIRRFHEEGIETRPGFYPFSVMPFYGAPPLPISEEIGLNVVCLPLYASLTGKEIQRVCSVLKQLKKT